jgi:cytochrome bd-type quinol oxidase subunit 1
MDVVLLSRLQFATATMFHFLFVPFTLGLSLHGLSAGLLSLGRPFSA